MPANQEGPITAGAIDRRNHWQTNRETIESGAAQQRSQPPAASPGRLSRGTTQRSRPLVHNAAGRRNHRGGSTMAPTAPGAKTSTGNRQICSAVEMSSQAEADSVTSNPLSHCDHLGPKLVSSALDPDWRPAPRSQRRANDGTGRPQSRGAAGNPRPLKRRDRRCKPQSPPSCREQGQARGGPGRSSGGKLPQLCVRS